MIKVAITGKIRSGKDTFGSFFLEKGLKEFKFGDGIREIIEKYYPGTMERGKPRRHYQHIGQQLRVLDNDVWVNYTLGNIRRYCTLYPSLAESGIIVTDMRQPNEADRLRAEGFTIIKVEAEEATRIERMRKAGDQFTLETLTHETELNVDRIAADIVINNNGSKKDLYLMFCQVWKKLQEIEQQE